MKIPNPMPFPVGVSLLAMGVNDNARGLKEPIVRTFFASKLAPTENSPV